jgi:peroxiredoxin
MTDFKAGRTAPDFTLSSFTLSKALGEGLPPAGLPLLLTFYKKTCPTCQLTYPFFERLHKQHGKKCKIFGIGQDPETKEFSTQYGITFPMIPDPAPYLVSKLYHLTTVPTAFLILPSQKIDFVTIGFVKNELIELSRRIASLTISGTKEPPFALFNAEDGVPEFKPG